MKPIKFEESASQRVYDDYIGRVKRVTAGLLADDRQDVLMEFNSHIYEGMQRRSSDAEIDALLDLIDKLGVPEEVLKPLVAEKKLYQATKTFNPIHVFKALILNVSNGISYVLLSLLYLFQFAFIFLIFAKLYNPAGVGLFFDEDGFRAVGMVSGQGAREVLGGWFIPLMLLAAGLLYVITTLLMRLKRKKKA